MKRSRILLVIGIAALCLGAEKGGCGAKKDDGTIDAETKALAEDAGDTTGAADTATSIVSIPVLALTAAKVDTAENAAITASNVGIWFKPAGCVTGTASGGTVTYEFKNCITGPLGLTGVNGKLTGTFSLVSGGVKVAVKSEGLRLNKSDVEQSATVTVTWNGSVRTATWDGSYKGITNTHKLNIEHTASYTSEWDVATGCVKWEGSGSTTIDNRGLDVTVTGYERCASIWKCPASGTITAKGKSTGLEVKLEYLGGGDARLTGAGGKVWDYKMLWCFP